MPGGAGDEVRSVPGFYRAGQFFGVDGNTTRGRKVFETKHSGRLSRQAKWRTFWRFSIRRRQTNFSIQRNIVQDVSWRRRCYAEFQDAGPAVSNKTVAASKITETRICRFIVLVRETAGVLHGVDHLRLIRTYADKPAHEVAFPTS